MLLFCILVLNVSVRFVLSSSIFLGSGCDLIWIFSKLSLICCR
nr:MAG TPA: hypothetical protein [Caudoviricetes sp.]